MKKNKLIKTIKQATAGLLAGAMVLTGAPLGSMTSWASTLQPNADLSPNATTGSVGVMGVPNNANYFTFGSSNSTAYTFGSSNGHSGTNTGGTAGAGDPYTFNVAAVTDEAYRSNTSKGYYSNAKLTGLSAPGSVPDLQSAFGQSWWHGYYAFAKPYRIGTDVQNKTGGSPYTSAPADAADPVVTAWDASMPRPNTASFPGSTHLKALHTNPMLTTYKNGDVFSITNPNGGTVDVRQEVMPSADEENILVKYTVYNNSGSATDFMIGNESDTQLGAHDDVPIFVTKHGAGESIEGLHFHNKSFGDNSSHAIFDIVSEGGEAGMSKRDSADKSENRVWAGSWSTTAGLNHTDWVFSQSRAGYVGAGREGTSNTGDTAAAFSAYFQLDPHEYKSTVFSLAIKPYVFYVNPNTTKAIKDGFMGSPVKSIQDALNVLATKPTDIKKAYIYVQGDVELDSTINIPAGRDITIQTTDYDAITGSTNYNTIPLYTDDIPTPHDSSSPYTIKRKAGFKGPMFKVDQGTSNLSFYNITVDGNNSETAYAPVVELSAGSVKLRDNTTIQNNNVAKQEISGTTYTPKASAIDVSGSGVLTMNGLTKPVNVINNISTSVGNDLAVPAIAVTSNANQTATSLAGVDAVRARAVNVAGSVTVDNNKDQHKETPASTTTIDTKANVALGTSMLNVETGRQFTGTIGVSVSDVPQTSGDSDGRPIIDYADRSPSSNIPYSAANVPSDVDGITSGMGSSPSKVTDTAGAATTGTQDGKIVYLRAAKYDYTVTYIDPDGTTMKISDLTFGATTIPGTRNTANLYSIAFRAAAGSTVEIPMPTYTGYIFDSASGAVTPLTVATTDPVPPATTPTKGTVSGKTPAQPVDIVIKFARNKVIYKFDSQGGSAIADKSENVTAGATTLGALPVPAKAGFNFNGWTEYTDNNGNSVYDTGDTAGAAFTAYPAPSAPKTTYLYASWVPDGTLYHVTTYHKNTNAALSLTFGSEVDAGHVITSVVDKDHVTVPGYKYSSGSATPISAGTVEPNPATTPGAQAGHYHIASMPASAVTLNYKYSVEPGTTFTYTVRHVDGLGNILPGTTVLTSQRRAEQSISAMPDNSISGYTYSTYNITTGRADGAPGSYVLGLDHTETVGGNTVKPYIVTDDPATGTFVAFMPNQDVTIDLIYDADAGSMNLVRRYFDRITDKIISSQVDPSAPSTPVSVSIPALGTTDGDKLYGYIWDSSSTVNLDPAGSLSVGTDGSLSGTMPLTGNGIRADYKLSRDASKWRDINFAVAGAPNNNGSVNPLPAGAPTSFLTNDGSSAGNTYAYNFDKLKAGGYIPGVTPNRYYKFDGWYLDSAATIQVNGSDTFPSGSTPLTLYAKFVEDPSQWFDINFVAGTNGSISAPATLHIPYDYTWNQISSQLPTATPVANYIFNGWKDPNGTPMQATSTLTNHATYTAVFSQDPNTWGTNTGNITPSGRIGNDGSGEIVIDGTKPGNVYVISDKNGNIVAVVPGESVGNRTIVPNLIPGAHYDVQEGTPDTVATVGQPRTSVTGSSVSAPQDVYIPTVDNNYNVGYDPENDGMAQIVINPADPDADYALIDENGNVVQYPGSDNGWMTPVGSNPSTVTFNNLNPNETYTVVARRKGDSSIPNPLTKLPDGNQIVANPGDMADAPKYIVETRNGSVVSVGSTSVGSDAYNEAKAGDSVVIHADPVNSNGKNFLYWQVLAGRAVGVSGNITQADYTFTLSNSNIVLKAVYEPVKLAGDDADLTEKIKGGSIGEFGLEPSQIPALAHELTTDLDRSLNSVNGANVEYKVVFNKRDAKSNEKTAVKPVSISGINHPDAHTVAYSLDIELERYVNGRLVNNAIPTATASNANVDVIAQLPAEDVDQLDYQIFDVTPDASGNITPVEIAISTDVANNAGLVKFTGNLLHTYAVVYSKTFKVTFVDNKPVLDHLFLNDTSRNFYKRFKVRRKESVEDSYYSSDYAVVTAYAQNNVANALKTPFEDIYGVQYDYVNWSKKEDKLSVFDTTGPITKRMIVYAYYSDNRKEVAQARVDLGDTIEIAKELTGDPYLKLGEVEEINAAIAKALETLRQARDLVSPDGTTYLRMANWAELQQAIDALRELINKYSKGASDREDARNRRTGGASSGGSSSTGRGSKLRTPGEKYTENMARFEASNTRAFVLGVDGNWEKNPVTGGWSFVLNGGTPLNDMWGMISFTDSTGKKVSRWYYFDGQSTMATGWTYDSKNGYWYYMNTTEGPDLGQMVTGWVRDPKTGKWYYMNDNTGILTTGWILNKQDNRWYYLNQDGEMLLGWQNIGGKWYYFNTNAPQDTYVWDAGAFKWSYVNNNARPYGSMYAGEKTPDGYNVDASGAWN